MVMPVSPKKKQLIDEVMKLGYRMTEHSCSWLNTVTGIRIDIFCTHSVIYDEFGDIIETNYYD